MKKGMNGCSFTWSGKEEARLAATGRSLHSLKLLEEQSISFDATENMFIEGDNLEALKVLRESHSGLVRVIYIDPPYNKGGSFVYSDRTSNAHAEWLSMMFPRLLISRDLLCEEGAIFVSIDDNEVHNLRMMMNEVYGEDNFITTIIWEKKFSPQNDARWFSDNHDYILVYARNKNVWRPRLLPRTDETDARYKNPDDDPRGPWTSSDLTVKTYNRDYDYAITTPSGREVSPPRGRCWGMSLESFNGLVNDHRIWFGSDGNNVPRLKRFLTEVKQGITPCTIWRRSEVGDNQEARRTIRQIFGDVGVFETPKPLRLMKQILHISTEPDRSDIVLDFFAGSCTTAHAVLEQNREDGGTRSFIAVQLPERVPEPSRALEAGFSTVSEIGAERIRRVIEGINSSSESTLPLGFKFYQLE
ncbi:MAG: site-specific DNA-methyltransferase [Candidatus Thorarchaeota archaeon]